MALPPSITALQGRYKALPRQQQLGVLFGLPAVVFLAFSYLSYQVAAQLGRDPEVPSILTRDGGTWSEIRSAEEQIDQKLKVIAERAAIEARIASLRGSIRAAEARLPREAEKAEMREVIERLARAIQPPFGSVQLTSVRILEAEERAATKSTYRTVTYQTEIVGDMNGIIKYIDSIEKNQRFMTVNSISLKGGEVTIDSQTGKEVFGQHQVKMDLVTYVYSGSTDSQGKKP